MREMKKTTVKWALEIPVNWEVKKVKHGFYRKKAEAHQEDPVILSLARAGVKIRDISNNEGQIAESYYNYNPVAIDDLLLNPMDLYSGANCSISKVEGVISPAYINLRYKDGYNPRYYDYCFKMQYWLMYMFAYGKGVSFDNRWTLNNETLMNMPLLVPPYEEQKAIADYLDEKCKAIDVAIEEANASIEEYNALLRAIITDKVTGVDKPELQTSYSKWYKKVPNNWFVCKTLRVLCMPITDGPHTTPELFRDGIPFVSAEAVSSGNGHISFDHIRGYISEDFYEECCKKYVPQKDDIYMIKSGATTGRVAIVDTDIKFTIWSPLAVFRCNRNIMIPKYMFYLLQSEPYQKQVAFNWSFGTQQNIGMRALEQLYVCVPPINEQKEIVEELDKIIPHYKELINSKNILIKELEQYKKTLIYECVTGKKEVV